jgi:hypothetical protein
MAPPEGLALAGGRLAALQVRLTAETFNPLLGRLGPGKSVDMGTSDTK